MRIPLLDHALARLFQDVQPFGHVSVHKSVFRRSELNTASRKQTASKPQSISVRCERGESKRPAGLSPAGPCIQRSIRGFQYIRGNPESTTLADAKVLGAGLAAHRIGLRFERELLALIERAQTSAFNGADVNENVGSAVVGLNEAKTLGRVEPLNCSGSHVTVLQDAQMRLARTTSARACIRFLTMSWERSRFRRGRQGRAVIRMGLI